MDEAMRHHRARANAELIAGARSDQELLTILGLFVVELRASLPHADAAEWVTILREALRERLT